MPQKQIYIVDILWRIEGFGLHITARNKIDIKRKIIKLLIENECLEFFDFQNEYLKTRTTIRADTMGDAINEAKDQTGEALRNAFTDIEFESVKFIVYLKSSTPYPE